MEKQLNKISTAEMKKNMSEDTMTICECCEFLETMAGDDKNIKYEKESSNGCDILTVHFYNGTFGYTENMNRAMVTDGKMLKAIYRQMMELGCI